MIGTRNRSAGFASRGEVLCTIKRKKTKRILRGWTRLSLFAAQLFQFCSSILSQHLRWLPLWWRGTLQVRQSGRYGFLRVIAREDGREEDTATDSAQQVAPLPWAFLSPGFALVSLSLSLFVALVVPSLSSSPRSTLRCSFRSPAFSTFVNVDVLSSDPLVACISKRLITRYLTTVVIYKFHCIIRRFAKLIAPLKSWSRFDVCISYPIISYILHSFIVNFVEFNTRLWYEWTCRGEKKCWRNFILYIALSQEKWRKSKI